MKQLIPGKTIGKYTLLRCLGEGNQGEVWEVSSSKTQSHERLVLKIVIDDHVDSSHEKREMLLHEAALVSQIRHSNVVEIFDFGEEGGFVFLAMEKIEGEDLACLLAAHKKDVGKAIPWPIALEIAKQICSALSCVHELNDHRDQKMGLIHRDLKPSNLLFTQEGDVKLIDFGIAKATDVLNVTSTQEGVIKGTPAYMSPEQALGGDLDQRSDLFSLGIILYELITGNKPFSGSDFMSMMFSIVTKNPASLDISIPEECKYLIERLLEKDANNRFQSADLLHSELEHLLQSHYGVLTQSTMRQFYASLRDVYDQVRSSEGWETRAHETLLKSMWKGDGSQLEAEATSPSLSTEGISIDFLRCGDVEDAYHMSKQLDTLRDQKFFVTSQKSKELFSQQSSLHLSVGGVHHQDRSSLNVVPSSGLDHPFQEEEALELSLSAAETLSDALPNEIVGRQGGVYATYSPEYKTSKVNGFLENVSFYQYLETLAKGGFVLLFLLGSFFLGLGFFLFGILFFF